ncbi:MAG: hypothetical protein COA58_07940 [Bacteroidetes bacterium]|nr:MAG: hypothetical protein COA58_07940 [Bacteroidota bacterium]
MRFTAFIAIVLALTLNQSCKPDNELIGDCFVPSVSVNLTINMTFPEYFNLQNLGEYKAFEAGNRGIYVIHNYDDIFYAIERTCTYQSDNECSKIYLDNDILQLRCGTPADTGFVKCCESTYAFSSGYLTGPTRCNLKTYRISRSGNTLYVSN